MLASCRMLGTEARNSTMQVPYSLQRGLAQSQSSKQGEKWLTEVAWYLQYLEGIFRKLKSKLELVLQQMPKLKFA